MQYKITIITVCYNEVANIRETLDSVLLQTYQNKEVIVVDGGSTDGTREIIENEYASRLSWWCSEPDKGIYNGMNKGVEHATGDYVVFMNGGDCFHNHHVLENVFKGETMADVIEGNTVEKGTDHRLNIGYPDLANKLLADGICHQSAFIKRQLLAQYPYDERYKIAADWKFWIQVLLCDGCSHQYADVIVADIDINGTTFSNMDLNMQERTAILKDVIPNSRLASLSCVLTEYQEMVHDPVVGYARYLAQNSRRGYNIVRKIAKRVVKVVRMKKA